MQLECVRCMLNASHPYAAGAADVQRQVEQAVEEAKAAAEAESEETLNDLLACLGQEERKTDRCALVPQAQHVQQIVGAGCSMYIICWLPDSSRVTSAHWLVCALQTDGAAAGVGRGHRRAAGGHCRRGSR
jgi:hypothetical protein